jgi:hypothetical protein
MYSELMISSQLRRKASYEAIDLDAIREVDLNRLEPWDLIGTSTLHLKLITSNLLLSYNLILPSFL